MVKIVYDKGELKALKAMSKEDLETKLFFVKLAVVAKVLEVALRGKKKKVKKK